MPPKNPKPIREVNDMDGMKRSPTTRYRKIIRTVPAVEYEYDGGYITIRHTNNDDQKGEPVTKDVTITMWELAEIVATLPEDDRKYVKDWAKL